MQQPNVQLSSAKPDDHVNPTVFGIKPVLDILFRFILGGVFVWASWSKLMDPSGFAVIIQNYQILPNFLVYPVAVILPWLELLCGVSLITGFLVTGGITLIDTMLIVFIVSFVANMIRGIDVNCGCFSTEVKITGNVFVYLMRDFGMLVMGIWIMYYRFKQGKVILHQARTSSK